MKFTFFNKMLTKVLKTPRSDAFLTGAELSVGEFDVAAGSILVCGERHPLIGCFICIINQEIAALNNATHFGKGQDRNK